MGPAAKKFIDDVVAECEMSEVTRKAAASKIVRAIGIEVMHNQAFPRATLVQELRNEELFRADFANGVVWTKGEYNLHSPLSGRQTMVFFVLSPIVY